MHRGSCLCGAISIEVSASLDRNDACHCSQCRKWTGHYYAGTDVPRSAVKMNGEEKLTWFHSSEKVRRGFCSQCGSSILFDPIDKQKHDWIGVSLGLFDTATHTKLSKHIFVANKGDYYDITDNLPQE